MDIRKIKKLIELLQETDVSEIEITEGEEAVRISRQNEKSQFIQYAQPMSIPLSQMPHPPAVVAPAAATPETTASAAVSGKAIKSPMVGTFYTSASPEADAFVKVGDTIKAGDTVCIIEAMKMFNRIEAEFSGTIKEVLIASGEPVEYDEPLFIVE